MRRLRALGAGNAGMSLIEATIILMVLALLTAVLAPSAKDYLDDARRTKVKEDVEAIGASLTRLLKDTGTPFLLVDATVAFADRYKKNNRVDLTVGSGSTPTVAASVPNDASANITAAVSWTDALGTNVKSLYGQLIANTPNYTKPSTTVTADPDPPGSLGTFGLGWRGAYLSPVVGPDPWGFRYAVNSVYFGTASDATTTGEGKPGTGWSSDVFVLSAGQNNKIEINFTDANFGTKFQNVTDTAPTNDDVVYVISGYGR